MRASYTTEEKSRADLVSMVQEIAKKLYRHEREKTVLRRALQSILSIANGMSVETAVTKVKIKSLAEGALAKTDARNRRRR